ncbi:hypothetical protein FHK02_1606 [Spirosoma sp. LMG 31448]|uniref:Uncharacterized protein n=1 Tax=Spirosoma utsteinense TaxID=2585773 RepID=A0ABR6W1Y0_9BACT|nr:hypothetical protein [Spirosoma utsteinense]MBC3790619.1 hypothetical protein [Spirosoma utsteinense]
MYCKDTTKLPSAFYLNVSLPLLLYYLCLIYDNEIFIHYTCLSYGFCFLVDFLYRDT